MISALHFALNEAEPHRRTPSPGEHVSRRNWLRGLGVVAGSVGLAEGVLAAPNYAGGSTSNKLLRRITFGPTEDDQTQMRSLGYEKFLTRQLNFSTINDSACENVVQQRYPRVFRTARQLSTLEDYQTIEQMREATLYRNVHSKRQLHAKMVEFWSDHFNVLIDKPGGWLFVPMHNEIRLHAMGRFVDLLRAVAKSPAMLSYLDNTENFGDWGNVNFAREIMELHTISVAGGYTPTDIRNVQRAFSGWEFYWEGPKKGEFRFDPSKHSTLPKVLFGTPLPGNGNYGEKEGDYVIDVLARHPSTALHISKKLLRYFLNYEPDQSSINHVASVFVASGGNIRTVLKTILASRNVAAAPAKLKRPYHMILSGLRSMRATFDNDAKYLMYNFIEKAGQLPFAWEPPDGYPDRLDFWSNLILPRWNFALAMPKYNVQGTHYSMTTLLQGATTPAQILGRIDKMFFQGEMEAQQKADLLAFLQAGNLGEQRIIAAFALAMASPNFQWH